MTFDQLVNMYLVESKQSGPPYIVKNTDGTCYYKDPEHKILHRDEKDPVTGLSLPACEYSDGSKFWYVDGKQHRLDGPAIEHANGSKSWYVDGKRHRLDGPAIEYSSGMKSWYVDGKRHRLDGPAIEYSDGSKEWFVDGKQHRLDGPAVEYADGSKEWYVDGKLHRLDGPAIERINGDNQYYIKGKELTKEEFDNYRASLDASKKVSKTGNQIISKRVLDDLFGV